MDGTRLCSLNTTYFIFIYILPYFPLKTFIPDLTGEAYIQAGVFVEMLH